LHGGPVPTIEVVDGDLLDQRVDAIVNAWNRNFIPWWLLLPQGVSGAIKQRAGFAPFRELRKFGMLSAGAAVVTTAGKLPYRGIIHVAGLNAFWRSSEAIVRECVRNALRIAADQQYASIAFPLIGAGTGGLDPQRVETMIQDESLASHYRGRIVVVRRQKTRR
jgi:O-acetyl-ADP-ribose deacetylase